MSIQYPAVEVASKAGLEVYCPACGIWQWAKDLDAELSPGDFKWKCPSCETKFRITVGFEEIE